MPWSKHGIWAMVPSCIRQYNSLPMVDDKKKTLRRYRLLPSSDHGTCGMHPNYYVYNITINIRRMMIIRIITIIVVMIIINIMLVKHEQKQLIWWFLLPFLWLLVLIPLLDPYLIAAQRFKDSRGARGVHLAAPIKAALRRELLFQR